MRVAGPLRASCQRNLRAAVPSRVARPFGRAAAGVPSAASKHTVLASGAESEGDGGKAKAKGKKGKGKKRKGNADVDEAQVEAEQVGAAGVVPETLEDATPAAPRETQVGATEVSIDIEGLTKEVTDLKSLGTRGEELFVGQLVLIFGVAFPPEALDGVAGLLGAGALLFAASLVYGGVKDLGTSLSPFPEPRKDAGLVTSGVYGLVRHPMYGALLLGSAGLCALGPVPARVAFTALLLVLLDAKARREETALRAKFGEEYADYESSVPRFLPSDLSRYLDTDRKSVV